MAEATVHANGRALSIVGTSEKYLIEYRDWQADGGSVFQAAQDIPHGSLCIDVGANIGIMAISLAVQRPDCQIIAIEPLLSNVECLRRNIHENGIKNVEVINAAVGEHHGFVQMSNEGPWSMVNEAGAVKCQSIPLDDFADRNVAFVKIDTEGYEPRVLCGARKLFLRSRPIVHMEFNTWCLLLQHHDPISFAKAIWSSSDVIGMYYRDQFTPLPRRPEGIVHHNVVKHGSVSELVFRPHSELPALEELIYSPVMLGLIRKPLWKLLIDRLLL